MAAKIVIGVMTQSYYSELAKFILILFIAMVSFALLATHRVSSIALPELSSYQCGVSSAALNVDKAEPVNHLNVEDNVISRTFTNLHNTVLKPAATGRVFKLYLPTNWQVAALANRLCRHTLVGSEFASVFISWQPRESLTSQDILTGNWQMMWNRDHALSGLVPNWSEFYTVLLKLPSYGIYWFSQQQDIELNRRFFAGKKIGLLADNKSFSGYLAAMSQLNQHNIVFNSANTSTTGASEANESVVNLTPIAAMKPVNLSAIPPDDVSPVAITSTVNIQLFPNRHEMVQAFLQGKVSLISDAGADPILANWPANKKRLITDAAPMGNWYVSQSLPKELHCKLREALTVYQPMLEQVSQQALDMKRCASEIE